VKYYLLGFCPLDHGVPFDGNNVDRPNEGVAESNSVVVWQPLLRFSPAASM
jgi:hypothetical protein